MTSWADAVEEDIASGTHDVNGPPPVNTADFPSLAEAAKPAPAPKPAPKKKAKGKTLNLAELMAAPGPAGRPGPMLRGPMNERDILMSLPTASRGKTEGEEDSGRLGGGFRDYGGDRGGGFGDRRDGDRRGPRGEDGEGMFMPSRADEADDWGANRKFESTGPRGGGGGGFGGGGFGGGRDKDRDMGGGFRDREARPFSEADTVDSWGATRKYEPAGDRGGFRDGPGGFRDKDGVDGPRRGGPMFESRPANRADEEDQWSRGREFQRAERPQGRGSSGSRGFGFEGGRPNSSNPDAEDRWARRGPPPAEPADAPAAPASSAERPRLKLAPRTLPVEAPVVVAPAIAPPAPAPAAAAAPPRPKANPFGAARPREEVLREKGIDPAAAAAAAVGVTSPGRSAPTSEAAASPARAAPSPPPTHHQQADGEAVIAARPAASPVVSLESAAERELKEEVARLEAALEALKVEGEADEDDLADAQAAIEKAQAKLADAAAERAAAEAKAAEALANGELDDGNWEVPKVASGRAAAGVGVRANGGSGGSAALPADAPAPGKPTPPPPGSTGSAWGRPADERGRSRAVAQPQQTATEQRPSRAVAAGAPGLERKW